LNLHWIYQKTDYLEVKTICFIMYYEMKNNLFNILQEHRFYFEKLELAFFEIVSTFKKGVLDFQKNIIKSESKSLFQKLPIVKNPHETWWK